MKATSYTSVFLLLIITSCSVQAADDIHIPEDHFQRVRLIDRLEKEVEGLRAQAEDCERALKNIQDLPTAYSKRNLNSLKKGSSPDIVEGNIKLVTSDFAGANFLLEWIDPSRYSNIEVKKASSLITKGAEDLSNRVRDYFTSNSNEDILSQKKAIDSLIANFIQLINNSSSNIKVEKERIDAVIKEKDKNLNKLYEVKDKITELHLTALRCGVPIFALTVLLLFGMKTYKSRRDPSSTTDDNMLETATVYLITMTILIMGLAQSIPGEVLGTLLGGVSGYILNKSSSNTNTRTNK